MTQGNGGRERSFLDTLSQEQRDLVKYVQGMEPGMQTAWIAWKLATIEGTLTSFTAKALAAQSKATTDALTAANPPKTKGLSPGTVTFLTGAGIVIGGAVVAVIQQWM